MNTKIILELGCNHQGDINIAKAMINDAYDLKVTGVKLQKRDLELLPAYIKAMPRNLENSFGETYYEHRKVLEFSVDQIIELKEYAESKGLLFGMSVFDMNSLNDMVFKAKVKWIKLPSQFFNDLNLVSACFSAKLISGLTIVRSTGMHTTKEIIFDKHLKDFDITMYCRSIYPFEMCDADFGSAILLYKNLPEYACAYSSHDKDGKLIPAFVQFGAKLVERHYTLDKAMKGSDHATVSSDYAEMQRIIKEIGIIERNLEIKNLDDLANAKEKSNRHFYCEEMRHGM